MQQTATTFRQRPDLSSWLKFALVLAFAIAICIRLPGPVVHGRLWAEEGAKFYERATTMPWWQALWAPWGGYLNLVANAAPLLARSLVRLEYVPWITESIGLFFQCFPAVILVCARDEWLRPPLVRIVALLLVVTAPVTEEVYLQTLHSQFHLTLCCALILAVDIPGRRLGLFYGSILLLAPFCGPAACLLVPMFCARAILDRSRERALQALIIGFGATLQFLLFYSHDHSRTGGIGPAMLVCVVYIKQIVVPLMGRNFADQISARLQEHINAGQYPWRPIIATIVAFIVFSLALLRRRQAASVWMFLFACTFAPIAYHGALVGGPLLLNVGNGTRYSFIPEVLSALALLGVATGTRHFERWPARGAIAWILLIGFIDFDARPPLLNGGPSWSHEVALWRVDHSHEIQLWPIGWSMAITRE
jgi:hypothetical protein